MKITNAILTLFIIGIPCFSDTYIDNDSYNNINVSIKRKLDATQPDKFIADCDLYGFSIGSNWIPVYADDNSFHHWEYYYKEANEINHLTTFEQVMLQHSKSSENYAFVFRVGVSPRQCRNWGFLGINSHGDNWYFRRLETTCVLRGNEKLANFAPTNAVESGTSSIGINIGTEEANISGSISYKWSELSIVSHSSLATNTYHTIYEDYAYSNYTANTSFYYGMFTFKCDGIPWVDITHEVTYDGREWYGTNSSPSKVTYSHSF